MKQPAGAPIDGRAAATGLQYLLWIADNTAGAERMMLILSVSLGVHLRFRFLASAGTRTIRT
jgi:hypothetical protein